MNDKPASEQIDSIISLHEGWKAELLSRLRSLILKSAEGIDEGVKWKMANRPEGLPVWSHRGIVCFAEIWKDNIKLLFPKGAVLNDTHGLFNARLKSKDIRAIEFREDSTFDSTYLQELIREAANLNKQGISKK